MQDLEYLISYMAEIAEIEYVLPKSEAEQMALFRSLCRITDPKDIEDEFFYDVQDRFLQKTNKLRGPVNESSMKKLADKIYLWQGDASRLQVDAVVNAASEALLGYFTPCSQCIDDSICIYAGLQLKAELERARIKREETKKTHTAFMTSAYNLPAKYLMHLPDMSDLHGDITTEQLSMFYLNCLHLAWTNAVHSLAFSISLLDMQRISKEESIKIALDTINEWFEENPNYQLNIILNVFTEEDKLLVEKVFAE